MLSHLVCLRLLAAMALVLGSTSAAGCQSDARGPSNSKSASASSNVAVARSKPRPPDASAEEQRRILQGSARIAWNYVKRNYSASSGMAKALDTWDYVTIWDIASSAAAYYSAYGLKLIDAADYHRRMTRML